MENQYNYYASCPKSLEDLLADEIKSIGANSVKLTVSGVYFSGNLDLLYKICLWSRIANRIFLILDKFPIVDKDSIYDAVSKIEWDEHFEVNNTFAVSCTLSSTRIINNNLYGAVLVKDAVVDYFRRKYDKRPSIQKNQPDMKIHLHVDKEQCFISLDLSGDTLHKRGYRVETGPASIKENVAAALLYRAHWPKIAVKMGSLVDPMCGMATLVIEAAMMAADIAPGLLIKQFGFDKWLMHKIESWNKIKAEAVLRREKGLLKIPKIIAYDRDDYIIENAKENIAEIGLEDYIQIEKRAFSQIVNNIIGQFPPGLVVSNPPYGERLGNKKDLIRLYQQIGEVLVNQFGGWKSSIITGDEYLGKCIGLKPDKVNSLYNGAIKCKLYHYTIFSKKEREQSFEKKKNDPLNENTQMFANRLKKNLKQLRKWIKNEGITSYRIYDADMPEYSASIDYYEEKWVHIQEYKPPKNIPKKDTDRRLMEIKKGVMHVLNIDTKNIYIKQQSLHSRKSQYKTIVNKQNYFTIYENGLKFLINLSDYQNGGIFLNQRLIREKIMNNSDNKSFLNLFSYTGCATVCAAAGGAKNTTTVDNFFAFIDWAKMNLEINGLDNTKHKLIKEDCFKFLKKDTLMYDIIFLDPPVITNSKNEKESFDVQRDHVKLIDLTMKRLSKEGTLIFLNSFRNFKMDSAVLSKYNCMDITKDTLPKDFIRNQKTHFCWLISFKK